MQAGIPMQVLTTRKPRDCIACRAPRSRQYRMSSPSAPGEICSCTSGWNSIARTTCLQYGAEHGSVSDRQKLSFCICMGVRIKTGHSRHEGPRVHSAPGSLFHRRRFPVHSGRMKVELIHAVRQAVGGKGIQRKVEFTVSVDGQCAFRAISILYGMLRVGGQGIQRPPARP